MATTVIVVPNSGAVSQAQRAEKLACEAFVRGYQHDQSSVAQMKSYSSCIDRLHPKPATPEDVLALKVALVIVAIAMCIGAYKTFKDKIFDSRLEAAFFGALAGLGVGLVVCILVWFVLLATRLFNS